MVKRFRGIKLLFDYTFVFHFLLAFDEANIYR
ncbi:hypothetical protein DYBT9623_02796 [Dyadobacter sp. CECT 9623]|jgi:hypothetical protein|uniref:Uncharacterized protein n=1 Tax=Dyadobacter linearis TaxID=2823330 RepID=A0ABN7R7M1_9BACT|nr:hypothetical protein DYBT9623_02796 [Dyadobacter sp. CECT 9623]